MKISDAVSNDVAMTRSLFSIRKTKSQILLIFTNLKMMNDSSKRHSKLLSPIFIPNCLSKASVIRIFIKGVNNNTFELKPMPKCDMN